MHRYFLNSIIIFLTLLTIGGCKEYEEIEFRQVRDLKVVGIKNGAIMIQGTAIFFNPNKRAIKLKKAQIDVFQGNKKVANLEPEKNIKIKSNDIFEIPVNAELNLKDSGLLRNIIGLLGKKEIELEFRGEIVVSSWLIPYKIEVSQKQKLRY